MSKVSTPEQLFVHELQDMYYAEKTLATTLPKLAQEASDAELSRAFTAHHKETVKHVSNLEKVFKQIGEQPEHVDGLRVEHGDDRDRDEVVDDCERQQEGPEGTREMRADHRQHRQCERDVGGRRDRPPAEYAAEVVRVSTTTHEDGGDREEDGGQRHTACRRRDR